MRNMKASLPTELTLASLEHFIEVHKLNLKSSFYQALEQAVHKYEQWLETAVQHSWTINATRKMEWQYIKYQLARAQHKLPSGQLIYDDWMLYVKCVDLELRRPRSWLFSSKAELFIRSISEILQQVEMKTLTLHVYDAHFIPFFINAYTTASLAIKDQQLEQSQRLMQQTQAANRLLQTSVADLEQQLSDKSIEIKELKTGAAYQRLEEQSHQQAQTMQQLTHELNQYMLKDAASTNKIIKLTQETMNNKKLIQKKDKQIEGVTQQIGIKDKQIKEHAQEIQRLKDVKDKQINGLTQQLGGLMVQLEKRDKEIDELKHEMQEIKHERKLLESNMQTLVESQLQVVLKSNIEALVNAQINQRLNEASAAKKPLADSVSSKPTSSIKRHSFFSPLIQAQNLPVSTAPEAKESTLPDFDDLTHKFGSLCQKK